MQATPIGQEYRLTTGGARHPGVALDDRGGFFLGRVPNRGCAFGRWWRCGISDFHAGAT